MAQGQLDLFQGGMASMRKLKRISAVRSCGASLSALDLRAALYYCVDQIRFVSAPIVPCDVAGQLWSTLALG